MLKLLIMLEFQPNKKADFFVHPTWSRACGNLVTPSIEEYELELRKRVENANIGALVVSVHEGKKREYFRDLIPPERTFVSGGVPTGRSEIEDCGAIIDEDEFRRLVDFIGSNGIDSALVHGSYLSQCTQGFAMQLFGIIHGIDIAVPGQTFEEADEVVLKLNQSSGMYGGGVELGDVLRPMSYDPTQMIAGVVELRKGQSSSDSVANLYGPSTRIFEMQEVEL